MLNTPKILEVEDNGSLCSFYMCLLLELNSRLERAFFLSKGDDINIRRKVSPFSFLHSFIFLSSVAVLSLFFLPYFMA